MSSTSVLDTTTSSSNSIMSSGSSKDNTKFVLPQKLDQHTKICGVKILVGKKSGEELYAPLVVITIGMFLRGVLMLGHDRFSGKMQLRDKEEAKPPSIGLSLIQIVLHWEQSLWNAYHQYYNIGSAISCNWI